MNSVAEIQGLYGPLTVPEALIQKIWRDQDFERENLSTDSGHTLRVRHPGKWNTSGEGPDFKSASIEINGQLVQGDIEIHFYAQDWNRHGHHLDPAFARVVLHVTLFPPDPQYPSGKTLRGTVPESLSLLHRLYHDIEEYASRDALIRLSRHNRSGLPDYFLEKPVAERRADVAKRARIRYQQKIDYAAKRIQAHGWDEACHQLLMEALGYRRNRAPMSALALKYPLAAMSGQTVDTLYLCQQAHWHLASMRQANHPRRRLAQYLQLLHTLPDWPQHLWEQRSVLPNLPQEPIETARFRRLASLSHLRETWKSLLTADAISGSRLDTLAVDVWLPLLAVRAHHNSFALWYHWPGGDIPSAIRQFQRQCQLTDRRNPACNGVHQGVLQLFLESSLT